MTQDDTTTSKASNGAATSTSSAVPPKENGQSSTRSGRIMTTIDGKSGYLCQIRGGDGDSRVGGPSSCFYQFVEDPDPTLSEP